MIIFVTKVIMISLVYKSNANEVASVCKVLIKFLLKRLQKTEDGCTISKVLIIQV